MKNVYVDTDELSGKLLDNTIKKMEAAKKKLGYNYSADAYLEVAINTAKYNSPSGRQNLFNARFAESLGNLYGDIEDVLKKLSEFKLILQKRPDELCEIDERQKGELSNFWQRASYYWGASDSFFSTILGIGYVGSEIDIDLLTDEDRDRIANEHPFAKYVLSKEQIDAIKKSSYSETELNEKLQIAVEESGKIPVRPYSAGVSQGSIRYCNQWPNAYAENGWAETDKDSCRGMCNRACESMALSYLGIDQSPSSMRSSAELKKLEFALGIHDGYQATLIGADGKDAVVQVTGQKGFNRCYLNGLLEKHENDDGKGVFSPVMIRYTNGDKAHWILLLENNGDGSYQAIGPWSNPGGTNEMKGFTVNISDTGVVSGSGFSHCNAGCKVQYICQYTRSDMLPQK